MYQLFYENLTKDNNKNTQICKKKIMITILTPPFLTLAKKTFIISEPVVHSHKFVIGNGKSVA